MKVYTKESLIVDLLNIAGLGWIMNARAGNQGGIGNTLEDLLGISENNLPIPNAAEWELKTTRLNSRSLITLFHMEPSPTAFKLVPQLLLPLYGWPHDKAGTKYPLTEMSFRQTINARTRTDRGFGTIIDRKERRIEVSFDSTAVAQRHAAWLESVRSRVGLGELSPQPYWGFDDFHHKVGSKLHNTFLVQAEVKKEGGVEFYKYSRITMLQGLSLEGLLVALETGDMLIDFDARTGHNHGTKFRFRPNKLPILYEAQTVIL